MREISMLEAIQTRMSELARERNKTPVEVGKAGGLRQSTVSELYRGKNSKYPRVLTIQRYCNGAGITLKEFFDHEMFERTTEALEKTKKE